MDRPLSDATLRRRRLRRASFAIGLAGLGIASIVFVPGWIRPSISLSRIRTAVVERGVIEATVTATGRVVPRVEHVITSPIDSRVRDILHDPGDDVVAGEAIVALDTAETERALQKLDEQIALQENERRRTRLGLEQKIAELEGGLAIKDLEIESYRIDEDKSQRLLDEGLITEDVLRGAKTDVKRALIEREQLERTVELERKTADARLQGIDLEVSILRKDRADVADRLARATGASERDGVLTWVVSEAGAAVARGAEIARVADLSSFRVEASLADTHAERVAVGQDATVRVGDARLRGRVSTVFPAVENGTMTVELTLEEPSHPALRPNLRVEADLVLDRHEDALFVPRGAFVNADGQRQVFVVRDDSAIRTPVEFGILNFDTQEIVRGLQQGDRVVLTDMSDYAHIKEVRIR
ncbi:MAG: HlyD family efflux transporter periplasmic adaptor subunit [bacterium]